MDSWFWSKTKIVNLHPFHMEKHPNKYIKVRTRSWRSVLDTTLCDKVCQWLATGWWFSQGTPVPSSNKTERHDITDHHDITDYHDITDHHDITDRHDITDHHDIAEILLKVALNIITLRICNYFWTATVSILFNHFCLQDKLLMLMNGICWF